MTMEEVFRREKEEADRLLREQKLEYENRIVQLQKQVMETSMSQSMLSSVFSSTGLSDSTFIPPQTLPEDLLETTEHDLTHPSDCSWSEQDYQLAWWTWKKWRYHRMTSLRVRRSLACSTTQHEHHSGSFLFFTPRIFLRQRFSSFPLNRTIPIVYSLFG